MKDFCPFVEAKDHTQVEPVVGEALVHFADANVMGVEGCYRVYVANLSFLGAAHANITVELAGVLAGLLAAHPAKSCAIVLHPNTGVSWNRAQPELIAQASRAVNDKMEDGCSSGFKQALGDW